MIKLITRATTQIYLSLLILVLFAVLGVSVSAQSNDYSLVLSESTVTEGGLITIQWTAPADATTQQDWIGLYEVGSSNRDFLDWKYISTSKRSLSFVIDTPGRYEFRYLKNNGYEQVARSNQFVVTADTPPPTSDGRYTLTVPSASYDVDDTVVVTWSAPTNRSVRQGWIGVYATNASNQQFESWQYINQSSNSGVIELMLRNTGTYELRFFTGNGYERLATSRSFTVTDIDNPSEDNEDDEDSIAGYQLTINSQSITAGQSVSVSWTANTNDNRQQDWIGLYRVNAPNRSFLDWTYVRPVAGTAHFTIATAGTYEFRYLKNNGYTSVATSPSIQVTSQATNNSTPTQCAITDLSQVTNYPPPGGPIIAFGDSLTAGVGAANNRDYVSQLEDLVGVPIRNEGVSGDTTEEALARLESSVLVHNPATVIVWLGGNDILGRYYARVQSGLENASVGERLELLVLQLSGKIPDTTNVTEVQTFTNLETIVNRIHDSGAVVILVGFSGGVFDDDLDMMYQAVASATGAIYVPDIMSGIIGRPSLMSDLVHPNSAGYAQVAGRIAPYVSCVL